MTKPKKLRVSGQQKQAFISTAELHGTQPIFYILHCYSKTESFYKIGITLNHILIRYSNPKAMPYNWKILLEQPLSASEAWDLERQFKIELQPCHIEPSIPFAGSKTECYSELSTNILNHIQSFSNQPKNQ